MIKYHLFKLIKGSQELHILGTAPKVSFDAFPGYIKDFLISHRRLITESKTMYSPLILEDIRALGFVKEESEEDLLSALKPDQKNLLLEKVANYLEFKHSDFSIEVLNWQGLYNFLLMTNIFENSMDYYLIREFAKRGMERVDSLDASLELTRYNVEDPKGELEDMLSNELDPSWSLRQEIINTLYLKRFECEVDDDKPVERALDDNATLIEKIKLSTGADLICISSNRLYGDSGLLKILEVEGFTIFQVADESWEIIPDVAALKNNEPITFEQMDNICKEAAAKMGIELSLKVQEGTIIEYSIGSEESSDVSNSGEAASTSSGESL